jgi:hypothetical protein
MLKKVVFDTARDLAGLLGAILIIVAALHYVVNSAALEAILIDPANLNPAFALVIEVLRVVALNSVDSGAIWTGAVILAIVFVGAAVDFALGNFERHLAAAVGVRLDAIEALNTEWDSNVVNAGSLGSAGGKTPQMTVNDGAAAAAQQQQQRSAQAELQAARPAVPKGGRGGMRR